MKNFAAMSTKKLNALLSTVSDNDEIVEIQAVLATRNQSVDNEAVAQTIEDEGVEGDNTSPIELTDEDRAALAEIEKAKSEEKPAKANKVNKMTYDECVELAKSLEINIGHRCQVVPFNTIEWTDAVIRGVIADKRSNKVLYAIRCDDGRGIVKAHNSEFLKILEETAENVTKRRKSNTTVEKLDDDKLMELAHEANIHVGKLVSFSPTRELYTIVNDKVTLIEKLEGVIVAIVPDKRSGRLLYRIECEISEYDAKTETSVTKEIVVHKVSTASDVSISDVYNEEIRTKFLNRMEANELKKALSPADLLANTKKAYEKSNADLDKAIKTNELRLKALKDAEVAYEAWLLEQTENQTVTDENAEESNTENVDENDTDLN